MKIIFECMLPTDSAGIIIIIEGIKKDKIIIAILLIERVSMACNLDF